MTKDCEWSEHGATRDNGEYGECFAKYTNSSSCEACPHCEIRLHFNKVVIEALVAFVTGKIQ
jgi:hypothetical protein